MHFIFSLLLCLSLNAKSAELQLPALTSPVMDLGHFLNETENRDLSQLAYEIQSNKGPQITILTVPDLQGYEIEDYSIRVAEKWQLGTKEKDNGLLVILSRKERKVRIEVGNGIEGEITDYHTSKFTREVFPQFFKQAQFHAGLRMFMEDVAQKFNIKIGGQQNGYVRRVRKPTKSGIGEYLIISIIGVLVFGSMIFKNRPVARGLFTGLGFSGVFFFLGIPILFILAVFVFGLALGLMGIGNFLAALASSHGGGYGGGGRSSGGGGWSGGGGGFSGGGSSGSW